MIYYDFTISFSPIFRVSPSDQSFRYCSNCRQQQQSLSCSFVRRQTTKRFLRGKCFLMVSTYVEHFFMEDSFIWMSRYEKHFKSCKTGQYCHCGRHSGGGGQVCTTIRVQIPLKFIYSEIIVWTVHSTENNNNTIWAMWSWIRRRKRGQENALLLGRQCL